MNDSTPKSETTGVRWLGWAVLRPGAPLFVQFGGDEADAWRVALGWPDAEEIATAQATGARAFPVEIKEIASA